MVYLISGLLRKLVLTMYINCHHLFTTSFPRRRESIMNFVIFFKTVDSRLRGNDSRLASPFHVSRPSSSLLSNPELYAKLII